MPRFAKVIPRQPHARKGKIYIRNSGRDEKKKLAPEIQLERSKHVLDMLGATFDPARDVYDEGEGYHSAFKRDNLDQFDDMIRDAIQDPTCKYIASFDSSRIFRQSEAGEHTIKELERNGIEWHSYLNGHLSLAKEEHRLKTKVQLMMDEEVSRRTSAFLFEHYKTVKSDKGYAGHRPMFGLERIGSEKNSTVTWQPTAEFPIILEIFKLYATGFYGCEAIADILYKQGVQWRNPKMQPSRPYGNTIRRLLRRAEFYAPFVRDDALMQQVYAIRTRRKESKGNHRPFTQPPPLLWGLVYCVCGDKFTTGFFKSRAGEKRRYYTHIQVPECERLPRHVIADKVNAAVLKECAFIREKIAANRDLILAEAVRESEVIPPPPLVRIEHLRGQLAKLNREWTATDMSASEYNELRASLQAELDTLTQIPYPVPEPVTREGAEKRLNYLLEVMDQSQSLEGIDPADANNIMRAFIERVVVDSGQVIEVIPKRVI